jgi:hypothetical protein
VTSGFVDIMYGEIDDKADTGHPRRKQTDAGSGDGKHMLAADRFLMACTAALKRNDVLLFRT